MPPSAPHAALTYLTHLWSLQVAALEERAVSDHMAKIMAQASLRAVEEVRSVFLCNNAIVFVYQVEAHNRTLLL